MVEKLVPKEAVPRGQHTDQDVVTNEKLYTQRSADLLKMTDDLPDGAKIILDKEDETPAEGDTVDEVDADAKAKDGEEKVDDTVPDDSTPTEGEPEASVVTPAVTPEVTSVIQTRVEENGKTQVKTVIDGVEEWIDDDKFLKGFQLNVHNQRDAQRNAEDRKALEQQKSVDDILGKYLQPVSAPVQQPPQKTQEVDVYSDDTPANVEPPAAPVAPQQNPQMQQLVDKLSSLEGEVAGLRKRDEANAKTKAEEAEAKTYSLAYTQTRQVCLGMGLELPEVPDNQTVARIKAYAENHRLDPDAVAKNPAYLVEAMKEISIKSEKGAKPSAGSTPTPPKAEGVKRTTPEAGVVKKLRAKQDSLNEKAKGESVDQVGVAVEQLRVSRELRKAQGG